MLRFKAISVLSLVYLAIASAYQRGFDDSPQYYQDFLCMCRTFATPISQMSKLSGPSDTLCSGARFQQRWISATAESEIKADKGGLVAKGFVSRNDPTTVVIAIRHQESESFRKGQLWEAMGLWGRSYADQSGIAKPGSIISKVASGVQKSIYYLRSRTSRGYYYNGIKLTQKILANYPKGYSMGGAIAQLVALFYDSRAVVFASPGVKDVLKLVRLETTQNKIINFSHEEDDVASLDCQIGVVCPFKWSRQDCPNSEPCNIHMHYVYGGIAWRNINRLFENSYSSCVNAAEWNDKHGTCASRKKSQKSQKS